MSKDELDNLRANSDDANSIDLARSHNKIANKFHHTTFKPRISSAQNNLAKWTN